MSFYQDILHGQCFTPDCKSQVALIQLFDEKANSVKEVSPYLLINNFCMKIMPIEIVSIMADFSQACINFQGFTSCLAQDFK